MAESDPKEEPGGETSGASMAERAKRDSLFLMVELARESGAPLGKARARNLSATGLMAQSEFALAKDDRLLITVRGVGQVSGQVVWVSGKDVGIAFDHEIDPQLARKPVHNAPAEDLPVYLRYLSRAQRFTNSSS